MRHDGELVSLIRHHLRTPFVIREPPKSRRGIARHVRGDAAVDVAGDTDVGGSENLTNNLERHAVGQHHRGPLSVCSRKASSNTGSDRVYAAGNGEEPAIQFKCVLPGRVAAAPRAPTPSAPRPPRRKGLASTVTTRKMITRAR